MSRQDMEFGGSNAPRILSFSPPATGAHLNTINYLTIFVSSEYDIIT
jgi:hypothetical protein